MQHNNQFREFEYSVVNKIEYEIINRMKRYLNKKSNVR